GFGIASMICLKGVSKKNAVKECVKIGVIWFVQLILMDLIFVVGIFGRTIENYYPAVLMYFNVIILSMIVGKAIQK
ncbi:MAG: hypothetical protein OQK82_00965, partial [Candidatus Pacearchaeota archaeon]|nr:hypothetical protein [Candidatus Pacearchaeota archaeon]